jgi:hypothetical protein
MEVERKRRRSAKFEKEAKKTRESLFQAASASSLEVRHVEFASIAS